MSALKWRRPVHQRQMILVSFSLLIVAIIVYLYFILGSSHFYMDMVAFIVAIIIGLLLSKIMWHEVWHSISTIVMEPPIQVISLLDTALVDGEMKFTRRGPTTKETGSPYRTWWDEVFELRDQRLHLKAFKRGTGVYLGPVRKDNRDEVERLKVLVEGALG